MLIFLATLTAVIVAAAFRNYSARVGFNSIADLFLFPYYCVKIPINILRALFETALVTGRICKDVVKALRKPSKSETEADLRGIIERMKRHEY